MPLSPEWQTFVDAATAAFPVLGTEVVDAAQARAFLAARPAPPAAEPIPVAAVEDWLVPGPNGAPEVPVRIYRPLDAEQTPGVVVFYHGGGFVLCNLDSHDKFCRVMANEAGVLVISVDYRRAPEARFPAAADDAYAVLRWVADNAEALGGDPARIAVAGDSAGGNLATVAALQARDNGGADLAFQLLLYPMLDPACDTASYTENAEGYFTTAPQLRWYWQQYLNSATEADDPFANPLRADLTGLPPAYIATAEFDPLRDEGETYGRQLREAGVPTEIRRWDGTIHGFMSMAWHLPQTQRANASAFAALRSALTRTASQAR
ncbi:alpha/beta hydrolase fold domain-containing protein [Nocardia sp. SYP-A9097]|uniref:alpha/beta hydrolase n=1 Tax=Nocardia sp. SYP-A9097 TaxID=2663237 RepID=UPI00129AB435|nr:alpha/beta hydrolase [Nocardia sp. SYP-A9097]MRH89136.1 alpha/beta hydrolase fold domain-containing protein [Nocardia sp. SYP-A9097]